MVTNADLTHYYQNPYVQQRIREYLGSVDGCEPTAMFITADGRSSEVDFFGRSTRELNRCLRDQLDIGRSLWDRQSLIAHVDIEYVNFDRPAEPYIDPQRSFALQQPVISAMLGVLKKFGITPLHLLTGRGHHLVWSIDRQSHAFHWLSRLGRVPEGLESEYLQHHPPTNLPIESSLGSAFAGLGLVMEFLAQRTLEVASCRSKVPLMLTAVEVGVGERGREIVSLDLSEYGDPLHTRGVRVPFSAYLKPYQQQWLLGEVVNKLPQIYVVPHRGGEDLEWIHAMRDLNQTLEIAECTTTIIPEQSLGTERMIAQYVESRLAQWHEYFYSVEHEPWPRWPHTYDRVPARSLPLCIRLALEKPNDLLLKPAVIQCVVRTFLAMGWHPRQIAGLIRSKYERNYGWGSKWYRYNAAQRADFFVRLFSGYLATGGDKLIDFNCKSCQEKRYCAQGNCRDNLAHYRESLQTFAAKRPSAADSYFFPHVSTPDSQIDPEVESWQ